MKKVLILICFLSFSMTSIAQNRFGNSGNTRIGIAGGYSLMNIITDNFDITPNPGWNVGFEQRGMMYNKFDMVYGMSFHQAGFTIPGKFNGGFGSSKEIEYTSQFFQIKLLGSYRAISNHLNIDFGPIFQLNGKLKYDELDNNYSIGSGLLAPDIRKVSQFNFYLAAGITGGFESFRVGLLYQYGLTNYFAKANKTPEVIASGVNLKGNLSLIMANIIIYI